MRSPVSEKDFTEYDPETLTGERLQEMDTTQLGKIFSGAESPESEEICSRFKVLLLAGTVDNYLPTPLKKLKARFFSGPLFPLKNIELETACQEEDAKGTKYLVPGGELRLKLFDFKVGTETSEFDGRDSLNLNYDTPKNILFIKNFRDEIRKVNSGLYIGRVYIMTGAKARFLGYFSLEPE